MAATARTALSALPPDTLFRITALAVRRGRAEAAFRSLECRAAVKTQRDAAQAWQTATRDLIGAIRELDAAAQTELIALAWLGGVRGHADWAALLADAASRWDPASAFHLAGLPDLPACLEQGWQRLRDDAEQPIRRTDAA